MARDSVGSVRTRGVEEELLLLDPASRGCLPPGGVTDDVDLERCRHRLGTRTDPEHGLDAVRAGPTAGPTAVVDELVTRTEASFETVERH